MSKNEEKKIVKKVEQPPKQKPTVPTHKPIKISDSLGRLTETKNRDKK